MKLTRSAGKLADSVIELPCACANLLRATRLVARLYDDALRPAGLRATQFTLLQSLHLAPRISQKDLARLLGIDSTTLTRTLSPLRRKGWLRATTGADRRELRLVLTPTGRREYKRVLPYWQSAQNHLRRALGEANWNDLMKAAVHAAAVTPKS